MRDRALLDRLPKRHAMRIHATLMHEAFKAMELQLYDATRRFIVAWDIARQTWQDYTGETLP